MLVKKASHNVELFQPSITLTKEGDALSKIGDKVDYTITLANTSSADTPDLVCTISDPKVGVNEPVTLASGASKVVNVDDFEIPADAADPFPNEATATCASAGLPERARRRRPAQRRAVPAQRGRREGLRRLHQGGDTLACTITITNTSPTTRPT